MNAIKTHFSYLSLLVYLLGVLGGCIEPTDISTQTDQILVINGRLTNATNYPAHVWVETSTSEQSERAPISDASVIIRNENAEEITFYYNKSQACYLPKSNFVGSQGTSYQLEVKWGEQLYQSDFQKLPSVNSSDKSYYKFKNTTSLTSAGVRLEEHKVQVYSDVNLPASNDPYYLRWDVEEIYLFSEIPVPIVPFYSPKTCFIHVLNLPTKINLVANTKGKAIQLDSLEIINHVIDVTFAENHYFGIFQASITKEAYEYWNKIDQSVNRTGSLFEIAPATITGNIKNCNNENEQVLGFFEVASMDTTAVIVQHKDLPTYIKRECEPKSYEFFRKVRYNCMPCVIAAGVDEECVNCSVKPNSTRKPPAYYERAVNSIKGG